MKPTMLTEKELNGIEERWENATKGPWEWSLNERAKSLILSNRAGLIVMDFVRWGMQRAIPRFRNSNVLMESPLAFAEVFPGREHHQDWCKRVNHPDAVAIENAPVDVSKLISEVRELQADNARLREQLTQTGEKNALRD